MFGQRTADIANGDAWLDLLERFGIVSPRGVLLEGSTLLQNLAMPFTLAIDPVSDEDRHACAGAGEGSAGSMRHRWLGSGPEISRPTCGCSRIWRARWRLVPTSS